MEKPSRRSSTDNILEVKKKPKKYFSDISGAIQAVRSVLTPDLLKPSLRNSDHPYYGHCYVAAEAVYHLTGCTLEVWRAKDNEGIVHWWLKDALGNRYDPTSDQYYDRGKEPPYDSGRRAAFLTGNQPSKRCQIVLERVLKDN